MLNLKFLIMKNALPTQHHKPILLALFFAAILMSFNALNAQDTTALQDFNEYSGIVVDENSGDALVFASLEVENTNISTVTNSDGKFLLKVPSNIENASILISFLGYKQKKVLLSSLKKSKNKLSLEPEITKLSEATINTFKDPKDLVQETLKRKASNNLDQQAFMTAFYRETIKKRRKNVSLAEAIVNVYKQPYNSNRKDNMKLYKARKSTDYSKLDTVALKLQGGPFNALYVDMMKYPQYIFTAEMFDYYNFSYLPSTTINGKAVYIVKFEQNPNIAEPLFYGKLYIDAETLALNSAIYNLNVENKELTGSMFVKKKPKDIKVYPTKAAYRVDYREKNGKWYYSYSNVQITFKINKKRKLFNTTYSLSSEMAITDWKFTDTKESLKFKERLKPSIIITDEASGFSDPEFWGAYNVIEPEKSIESAINKIKRQLKKAG